jgi:hypothetical protein
MSMRYQNKRQITDSNFLCIHEHFNFVHDKSVAIETTYCFVDIGGIVKKLLSVICLLF